MSRHTRVRVCLPALIALLFGFAAAALAAGVRLVTDEEVSREASYAAAVDDAFEPRAVPAPGAPVIEVRSPTALAGLKAPFPINVAFKTSDGAEALPGTFKVFYGRLRLDITDRVLQKVHVGREGVVIDEADIPAGSHRLLLQVRDSRDRIGEMVLTFTVAR